MSGYLNKATLIGNVGKEPEIRTMDSGRKVASFSIATGERWKDKVTGERKERTEWHNIVVFNEHTVGVVEQYVKKGSKIYVEGQLQTRKFQDKNGQDRQTTEIVLQAFGGQLVLLDSAGGGTDRTQAQADARDEYGRGAPTSSGEDLTRYRETGAGMPQGGRAGDLVDDDIPF